MREIVTRMRIVNQPHFQEQQSNSKDYGVSNDKLPRVCLYRHLLMRREDSLESFLQEQLSVGPTIL